MHLSWGTKLLIVFAVFAGNICYMVYQCVKTPVNLVTAEYYKDELVYQDIIDGTKMADALSKAVSLQKSNSTIILQLPHEMKNMQVNGTVLFYCPSNMLNDKKVNLSTNADGQQVINTQTLVHGKYVVKIEWNASNKHYYNEQPLTLL